ncbi:SDR family NAD(P)-dependent oxidoreductase [Dactylosporangium sp. NPDC049140]|uniref:SDR family NAD(P)-dependent oxidoreductase n=1 Tax=Dactylosporangium sp. NPDC049140 TaxID=3155647 RepID=UPI0033C0CE49
MSTSRTIAVFGAGTGLGTAVAHRFGRAGYRVALVARTASRLDTLAGELAAQGIESAAFPADLSDPAAVPDLLARIEDRLGPVDVLEYAPITTDLFASTAALDAAGMQHHLNLHLLTPIELVRAALPGLRARGDGGILLVQGISALNPMPRLGGLGPAMAAARNWVLALNAELAGAGVYAGVVHVGAMVTGSAGHRAMTSGALGDGIDVSKIPQVDPADIATALWDLLATRDRSELLLP